MQGNKCHSLILSYHKQILIEMNEEEKLVGKKKGVKLVPIPYSNPPVKADFNENETVERVVRKTFPEIRGPLIFQNEKNAPVSPVTRIRDVNEVRFMPYTEGYQCCQKELG